MFRRFRIAILLYILIFVALGQYLTARRSTDWNESLWVDVYALNADGSEATQNFIDALTPNAFSAIEEFFAAQAAANSVGLELPFRIRLVGQLEKPPPPVPDNGAILSMVTWSLKMRWFVTQLHWSQDGPTPDITVFAVYHDGDFSGVLDRSTALRKGMFALTNLYAKHSQRGSNQMIVAHELLHTLGATDKYDLATTLPLFPQGFADPDRSPLYPQSRAELMGGRVPINQNEAQMPGSLKQVLVGPVTAAEIGWIDE